jgi:RNA polymerase sigma-70 factor, ECF subfamily
MQYHGLARFSRLPEPLPNPQPGSRGFPVAGAGLRPPGDEDSILLDRVQKRDQDAMAQIFDRYSGMAYAIAQRVLNDSGQAEDVIQEVFFQIWQNPGAIESQRGSLGPWLAVVVRNRSIDVIRRRRPSEPVEGLVLASSTDMASEIERKRLLDRVRGIVKQLPAEQRESLELAFFSGLTHAEIAEQKGEPLGTVKTRIRMALINLRKAFQT